MGSGEREAQGMLATTLACCARAGDADAASRVVEMARAHGVTVGADANNALVSALTRGALVCELGRERRDASMQLVE